VLSGCQNGVGVLVGRNFENTYGLATIVHNLIDDYQTGEGILLYQESSSEMTVNHNEVRNNTDGIGLYTTSNAEIGWNHSHDNVPYDGLFADSDTAHNTIEHNLLKHNGEFDCDDISAGPYNAPALVANPWTQDLGYTENRPGLCKHAS
jgi:hypothetical protein